MNLSATHSRNWRPLAGGIGRRKRVKDMHAIVVRHIKLLLQERQMSDTAFAKKIRKPQSTVSKWFSNAQPIKLRELPVIAEALNVSEIELIAGPGSGVRPMTISREQALEVIGHEFGYDVVLKKRKI